MSRATVLVLEQNAAVQELIEQALCEAGNHVLGTNDALEALDILRRVQVDVLIAGSLPETRMEILLGELRSIQAELQVVSIDPGANGRATLASPISLAELVEAVAVKSQRVSG
jgi:DNA-binding NtrC family response regulator